jgi:hypothetical protein
MKIVEMLRRKRTPKISLQAGSDWLTLRITRDPSCIGTATYASGMPTTAPINITSPFLFRRNYNFILVLAGIFPDQYSRFSDSVSTP